METKEIEDEPKNEPIKEPKKEPIKERQEEWYCKTHGSVIPKDLNGRMFCPICNKLVRKEPYKGEGGVEIKRVEREEEEDLIEKLEALSPEDAFLFYGEVGLDYHKKKRLREILEATPQVGPKQVEWVLKNYEIDENVRRDPNALYQILIQGRIQGDIAQRIVSNIGTLEVRCRTQPQVYPYIYPRSYQQQQQQGQTAPFIPQMPPSTAGAPFYLPQPLFIPYYNWQWQYQPPWSYPPQANPAYHQSPQPQGGKIEKEKEYITKEEVQETVKKVLEDFTKEREELMWRERLSKTEQAIQEISKERSALKELLDEKLKSIEEKMGRAITKDEIRDIIEVELSKRTPLSVDYLRLQSELKKSDREFDIKKSELDLKREAQEREYEEKKETRKMLGETISGAIQKLGSAFARTLIERETGTETEAEGTVQGEIAKLPCPSCGGEITFPADAKKIKCIKCQKEFTVEKKT
jgi:hypothetical protein